ncbi:ABC transporter ATP-binding protein [Corynebacterium antarcticum]|uniref:ABC transporter ATP-binding protein n=1 Tax=Corynebacterium antarcticum TaxID=2800405 RepID=UPI002003C852|nr:ABC transporter ATP-binding protein [Corynebacterium antarcticum]MCK7642319.1 ABC transporter ATP-binding protein [Corynebacterium antarcticum]MCK7660996.1 ABC transporter ATP-binding protein [Corynebacterium antarcticum]MCX7491801.1 ABC transporter ATP-binding protein [Corynebacterium antarcticum]
MHIKLRRIEKIYRDADGPVVSGVSYTFEGGTFTALMGRSGSGKSTLLNIMSGITQPTSGQVFYDDTDIFSISDRERSKIRAQTTSTIFQDYNLLPFLTAAENIELGKRISKSRHGKISPQQALEQVGLSKFADKLPNELSGGQCQRVAIARAIAVEPDIIFADEPTGALDEKNSEIVVNLLKEMANNGVTVIMVTHDPFIAAASDRVIELCDGQLERSLDAPSAIAILEVFGHRNRT